MSYREPLPRLSDVVRQLGGTEVKSGRIRAWWRGGTNSTSVSIDDEHGRWYDNGAGCGGGIFDLVEVVLGCDRREAVRYLLGSDAVPPIAPALAPRPVAEPNDLARTDVAVHLWGETEPLPDTLGARYYAERRLAAESLEHVVRWHPQCPFGHGERRPCVVALFRDIETDEPCGIQRTALDDAGNKTSRRMLGRAKGAAIKLVDDADVTLGLGVAEGVETALSILQAGWSPVWALGSAGAIQRFPVLPSIESLTVWADNDPVGLAAADRCAQRWSESGVRVAVRRPIVENGDFNDRRSA